MFIFFFFFFFFFFFVRHELIYQTDDTGKWKPPKKQIYFVEPKAMGSVSEQNDICYGCGVALVTGAGFFSFSPFSLLFLILRLVFSSCVLSL
jgi:hypothetical protein